MRHSIIEQAEKKLLIFSPKCDKMMWYSFVGFGLLYGFIPDNLKIAFFLSQILLQLILIYIKLLPELLKINLKNELKALGADIFRYFIKTKSLVYKLGPIVQSILFTK